MSSSRVRIAQVRGRSVVVDLSVEAPLSLLTPDNAGHGAWVFQSNLGGGFVGADALELDFHVDAGATALLGAQASSKVYRAARSSFTARYTVAPDALLVVWPEPLTCFAGAALTQRQQVSLAPTASLCFVDAFSAGRVARGERWAFESLSARLDVELAGAPWLREALHLDARHGALAERLRDCDAFATVVLVGPRLAPLSVSLVDALRHAPLELGAPLTTVSPRGDGVVLRVLARDVEAVSARLRALLRAPLAALLGDTPGPPSKGARPEPLVCVTRRVTLAGCDSLRRNSTS